MGREVCGAMKDASRIAVGVIHRDGRFLISRRPPGVHLEGLWEFPGGKVRQGEEPADAVRREVLEEGGLELGFDLQVLHREKFDYPDRLLEILFYIAEEFTGEERGVEGQELRWVTASELKDYPWPPANRKVLDVIAKRFTETR